MREVIITDTITGQQVTCSTYDIAEAIAPWYPEAPTDVVEAIADFARVMVSEKYPEANAGVALGIAWEWAAAAVDTIADVSREAYAARVAGEKLQRAVADAVAAGERVTEVAEAAGVTRQTVYRWIGPMTTTPGRPPLADVTFPA